MTSALSPPPGTEPAAATAIFGDRVGVARDFVAILADTAVSHGLIGPREVPRLWDRHVLNCAVVAEAMPRVGSRVIDIGSGAGLPGIALAIARPDLRVTLVEPMLRRTNWLSATVDELGLDNVDVRRGRAEEFAGDLSADYVTARAVAALDKLARWCVPLIAVGGDLVAMKGASAVQELAEASDLMTRLGLGAGHVRTLGGQYLTEPTIVVIAPRIAVVSKRPKAGARSGRRTGSME